MFVYAIGNPLAAGGGFGPKLSLNRIIKRLEPQGFAVGGIRELHKGFE